LTNIIPEIIPRLRQPEHSKTHKITRQPPPALRSLLLVVEGCTKRKEWKKKQEGNLDHNQPHKPTWPTFSQQLFLLTNQPRSPFFLSFFFFFPGNAITPSPFFSFPIEPKGQEENRSSSYPHLLLLLSFLSIAVHL